MQNNEVKSIWHDATNGNNQKDIPSYGSMVLLEIDSDYRGGYEIVCFSENSDYCWSRRGYTKWAYLSDVIKSISEVSRYKNALEIYDKLLNDCARYVVRTYQKPFNTTDGQPLYNKLKSYGIIKRIKSKKITQALDKKD